MDYKEKYEQALKIAQETYNTQPMYRDWLEKMFPELAESEDEKVRKILFEFFKNYKEQDTCGSETFNGIPTDNILAWLEKQGEQKPNPYSGTSFEYNGHIWGMCARDNGVEILFDGELKAFLSLEKSFIYPIHPQPSLMPKSAQETINGAKVEPKFKVGDWVVLTAGELSTTLQIVNVDTNKKLYWFNDNSYLPVVNEECLHHWTIQDAKPGDVLAAHECFVLFKKLDGLNIRCYCTYHYMNNPSFYVDTLQNKDAFSPATKEQRTELFLKMKEAGYEWDEKKKKLKEIEKPTDVRTTGYWHVEDVEQKPTDEEMKRLLQTEYEKGRADAIAEMQKDWSEEDINMIDWLIRCCEEEHKELCNDKYGHQDIVSDLKRDCRKKWDWLESLKNRVDPQNRWKPSDEQMEALHTYIYNPQYFNSPDPRMELVESVYKDLKKLRE